MDASATSSSLPPATTSGAPDEVVPVPHGNAAVAFMIGLSIVLLASILNAAGLNLTKLDHVRTSAIPKASRRRDWLRPLWLLGMLLYILSQLIGSTLALEYLRAEYVAPLGSTSLIFNFLFARFLVGTPVTSNDIWGTVIVILGVIGIVAFGSINHGFPTEDDIARLTYLWTRGNWLAFFFLMSFALIGLYIFTSTLDAVLAARSDLSAAPFAGMSARTRPGPRAATLLGRVRAAVAVADMWIHEHLEVWTAAKDDKTVAWTLGIGWACCGGGLAGGTLVFAKAAVKLISGSLSHVNTGNQFGSAAAVFTFILLAATAVLQIICLNRGLKVYDSTLVVPVFYGVYTAAGFLDSLIFNDSVDAYESWTLFFIFVSILVLISGVVLLTHKKPDSTATAATASSGPGGANSKLAAVPRRGRSVGGKALADSGDDDLDLDDDAAGEAHALRLREEGGGEDVVWELGDASDDEDGGDARAQSQGHAPARGEFSGGAHGHGGLEGVGLMGAAEGEVEGDADGHGTGHRRSTSSDATLARPEDDFGDWKDGRAHALAQ